MTNERTHCPVDPLLAVTLDDPHPLYARLRSECPVAWSPRGFWSVFRHADVSALLRDPRCDHWDLGAAGERELLPQERAVAECLELLSRREPGHLRALAMKALTGTRVHALQDSLPLSAERLLAAHDAKGGLDVISDLADPLTFDATCEILGVPAESVHALRLAARAQGAQLLGLLPLPARGEDGAPPRKAFAARVHEVLEHRRTHRGDDLTSAMWAARDLGEPLSDAVMANLFVFLLYAGHENIMSFIGNAALSLLRNPSQAALLRARPELATAGFGELVRHDGPVHYIRLVTREALAVGGQDIEAGETVFVCLASANRDPEVFPDPDRLDLTRTHAGQLGFGWGPLQCIGAALAKIEGAAALRGLFTHRRELRLRDDGPPSRAAQHFVLRGLRALPVSFAGSAQSNSA
jgi:cytochrome P450